MRALFSWISDKLEKPLTLKSRMMLVLAVVAMIPTFFVPLWSLRFWSYQYPDGLNLYIYSHKLVGGDEGNDLREINILNHYIGMAELQEQDFLELKWIPLGLGIFMLLALRAIIFGKIGKVLDLLMIFIYFGTFSLWSFWYKLHYYGHNLNPMASVKIRPFTPPIFGFAQVGQFKVWSYPGPASYALLFFAVLLILSMLLSLKEKELNG
jgi:copper chaperone NosL